MRAAVKNLEVIHSGHAGKGAAVKKGMLEAVGEFRVFMDADNSTSLNHWDLMLPYFRQGFDVVIGSRIVKGSKIIIRQPIYKVALGRLGNLVIQLLALPGIWDSQCGFKAFTAQAAQKIFPKVNMNGWSFDVETLYLARVFRLRVKEIGITWLNDARSHVRPLDYLGVIKDVIRIKLSAISSQLSARNVK
jgi:dolichyl-phosphate beta-glucosyltransferase